MVDDTRTQAQQSPLSQRGTSIDTRQINAQGGTLSYINDIFRPANKAARIRNFHQFKRGVFSSSGGGWVRDNAAAINAGASGRDFGTYTDAAGTISLLAQFGNTLVQYDPIAHTATNVTGMTALDATAIPCMRGFAPSTSSTSPITVYTNGVQEPRKIITATTSAAMLFNSPGVWPGTFNGKTYTKPKLCTPFGQRMAYAGFATSGASGNLIAYDILISNSADAEKFTVAVPSVATDAIAFTVPGILGLPTAIRSLRLNNNVSTEVLIIGCQRGVCLIEGNDTTNYNLQILSTGYGIPSNRTFVQLNNVLFFLATDGFRSFSGENNNSNLLTDSISLDIYDEILNIDPANSYKAHATHHPGTQEILFWVPYLQDTGTPQHCIVINYNTQDGSPIFYWKDNTTVMAGIEFNGTMYGMTETGYVQKHYSGNFYDGGVNNLVPGAELILSLISVGNPAQDCSMRQVCVITDGGDQKFKINVDALVKMDDGRTTRIRQEPTDFILSSPSSPATALGSWVLGLAGFPGNHPKLLDDYTPKGAARYWQFALTCDDSSHNLDFAALHTTISIGGMRV